MKRYSDGLLILACAFFLWSQSACKKDTPPNERKTPLTTGQTTPAKGDANKTALAKADTTAKVKDLVCNMTIDPAKAAAKHEHKGKTYYFCNAHCAETFKKDPDKYAAAPAPATR